MYFLLSFGPSAYRMCRTFFFSFVPGWPGSLTMFWPATECCQRTLWKTVRPRLSARWGKVRSPETKEGNEVLEPQGLENLTTKNLVGLVPPA
jgi:hypothetical protein